MHPAGRKDVQFLFFEKQFCCAVVTGSSIGVKLSSFTCLEASENSLFSVVDADSFVAEGAYDKNFIKLLAKEVCHKRKSIL